ncbi:MAG: hypothetical protein JST14_16540 [Bacteroidetes bacterium]|nr:hypothetical protein [Bacteroidota bacterium]
MRYIFVVLCWLALSQFAVAQSSGPTSLDPGKRITVYSPQHSQKKTKAKKRKVQHTPEFEFYQRVERVAKEKQKLLKKFYKPQFRDTRYFGHRHIPKRRSAAKMRYCEECGIRH